MGIILTWNSNSCSQFTFVAIKFTEGSVGFCAATPSQSVRRKPVQARLFDCMGDIFRGNKSTEWGFVREIGIVGTVLYASTSRVLKPYGWKIAYFPQRDYFSIPYSSTQGLAGWFSPPPALRIVRSWSFCGMNIVPPKALQYLIPPSGLWLTELMDRSRPWNTLYSGGTTWEMDLPGTTGQVGCVTVRKNENG